MLAGQVASTKAGPGVIISFALAALASAFSAICYAEFAGRVPRAGSAYAYSYISVGEFVAFIIGWNLILEYVIGAASVARGFSGYLSYVVHQAIHGFTHEQEALVEPELQALSQNSSLADLAAPLAAVPPDGSLLDAISAYLVEYFDWPSLVIVAVITALILVGVKESTNFTLAFTAINLTVVAVVVISSLKHLNLHNWELAKSEVPAGYGEGGFLPYGWSGVLAGSATCFFGFIGFDTIASSAEESKHPRRNVPLSILLSLFISTMIYMTVAVVQTLLWPYYAQNKVTILPLIFHKLQMPLTFWIVLVGALAGLASSQVGAIYPLPRILYSMSCDKLIYHSLSKVHPGLKLPVRATIVGAIFVAILSCTLDIQDLADMVSIGTLAAYSLVSLSVLILRYEDRNDAIDDSTIVSNRLSFTDILSSSTERLPTDSLTGKAGAMAEPIDQKAPPALQCEAQPRDGVKGEQQQSSIRPKLTAKPSTPIREKGSRAVVAQLSVGFHSWFKAEEMREQRELDSTIVPPSQSCQASSGGGTKTGRPADRQPTAGWLNLLINWRADEQRRNRTPDHETSRQSKILIGLLVFLATLLDLIALWLTESSFTPAGGAVELQLALACTGCIVLVVLVALMLMLSRLPTSNQSKENDLFRVPLVPLVPMLSLLINTFLMLNLSYLTWVRFAVWMTAGLFIYFTYGIWNSQGYLVQLNG